MDHLFINAYTLAVLAISGLSLGMLVWAAGKDGEKQRQMEQKPA